MSNNLDPQNYYRSGDQHIPLTDDPDLIAVRYDAGGRDGSVQLNDQAARLLRSATPVAFIPNHGVQILHAEGAGTDGGAAVMPLDRDSHVDFAAPLRRVNDQEENVVVVLPQVLAKFREDLQRADIDRILEEYRARIIEARPELGNTYIIRAGDGLGPDGPVALANRLVDDGYALKASPDMVRRMETRAVAAVEAAEDESSSRAEQIVVRRVPEFDSQQWHLTMARVRDAWSTTRGKGVIIAILDDGVAVNHPEFSGRVMGERDFANGGISAMPMSASDNHGTACAGVALAGGVKASGVAPEAGLLAARTPIWLGTSEEVDMFRWCASEGASVVSCSWGPAQPHALPDMIEEVLDFLFRRARDGKGILVLFAAGNEAEDMSTDGYAASDHVMAVAASTDEDQQAWYSDFGPKINICAPSNGGLKAIFTTDRPGAAGYNSGASEDGDANGDYTNGFGGTSSATPLVAGVGALVLAANPALTAHEVRNILQSTADKIGDKSDYVNGHSHKFGYGRVNTAAAVRAAVDLMHLGDSTKPTTLTIDGPTVANKNGPPPTFTVNSSFPFWAVEVATDPMLFDEAANGFDRRPASFYSALDSEGYTSGNTYQLLPETWDLLNGGDILAYRVCASDSAANTISAKSTADQDAAGAKRIQLNETEPVGGAGGSSVSFPSGATFRVVNNPADGEDYTDPVANGLIPLIDTKGRLDEQLADNFILREFAARSGRYQYARVSTELVEGLQAMRSDAGAGLNLRSAYRPPALNLSVGGASKSQHLAGRAADISINGLTPLEVAALAIKHLGTDIGIGLGTTTTHVDLRGSLTTWVYEGAELSESEFDEWARMEANRRGGLRGERSESTSRNWPSVEGPAEWIISDEPPKFIVTPGRNAYVALEFTTNPKQFWTESTGVERATGTFVATWEYGLQQVGRSSTLTIQPSSELWQRLTGAKRIYYRALTTSADDGSWPDQQSSLSLDDIDLAQSLEVQRTARDTGWVSDTVHRNSNEKRWQEAP